MVSLVSKSYSKKLLRLISWGHWFTYFNICAAILLSSMYLFAESGPETLFGQVYLITTWFSHMAFLTFVGFVLIVFPITLLFPSTRFIRGFASIVFTISLVLLVLDAFTYQALGYHLNASSSEQILELINNTIDKDSQGFWTTTLIVATLILIFELVVSNYAWKHIHQLQQTIFAKYTSLALVAAFIFSHVSHIWADANLAYDVLKQDTLFPLSYPSTAKTLLTKYGLFDESLYIENRTEPLSFRKNVPNYPTVNTCPAQQPIKQSVYLILNKNALTPQQIELYSQRVSSSVIRLGRHIDNATSQDAWFNFFYGLPTIYQDGILQQQKSPVLFQQLDNLALAKNLTIVSDKLTGDSAIQDTPPTWFIQQFDSVKPLTNAAELIFSQHLTHQEAGLHIYYFDNENDDQLALFVDALLLSQQKKTEKDIIWLSSIGNSEKVTQLIDKASLFVWPQSNKEKIRVLTSQMDMAATLMRNWLGCNLATEKYTTGADILNLTQARVLANSTEDGLMIFEKDKSVFVDQTGNFQGYSRQLNAPIMIKPDYPLMINGVHHIKQYVGDEGK